MPIQARGILLAGATSHSLFTEKLGAVIPAFWREQYKDWANFKFAEWRELLVPQARLIINSDFDFKPLAFQELQKYPHTQLSHQASTVVEDMRPEYFQKWGKPGIRA